jgi:DNA-binding transcriptional MerR regulator
VTIAQLSDLTGVSKHTLRYYERMGLVPLVNRDRSSGHRRYTPDHARWIAFLRNLRQAGMPIREIRKYARLVARGPTSWPERERLLAEHRARVDETITLLRTHRRLLDQKLAAGCAPIGLGNPAEPKQE